MSSSSPYTVAGGRLLYEGTDLGVEVEPVARPRFYDLVTDDGVPLRGDGTVNGKPVKGN